MKQRSLSIDCGSRWFKWQELKVVPTAKGFDKMKLRFWMLLLISLFLPFLSFAEIPSKELVGLWRDSSGSQYLYVNKDLSWYGRIIQNERPVNIAGKMLVTTKGENEQGTLAVFFKVKGDNGWANIALILSTEEEEISDKTILRYDHLEFHRQLQRSSDSLLNR